MPKRYECMLHWDGKFGMAYCGGAQLELRRAPRVNGTIIHKIEYIPYQDKRRVCVVGAREWRPLTSDEVLNIRDRLKRMRAAATAEWA